MLKELNIWTRPTNSVLGNERDVRHMFDTLFRGDLALIDPSIEAFTPRIDVTTTEKEVRITAELPGVEEKDIHVDVAAEHVTLSGEKKQAEDQKGGGHFHLERLYGSFRRVIALPKGIDRDKVNAVYKQGILTVVLPKTAEAQNPVRSIPVKAE